jgi:hypothetical protein
VGSSSRAVDTEGVATSTGKETTPTTSIVTDSTSGLILEEKCHKANRIILPTVKDSLYSHIMHITDPRLIWIKLRDLYESKSMNKRLSLNSDLYTIKMTEKMFLEEHLMKVNNIVCQLANIGVAVLDEELVDRGLTSLPNSWDIFRQLVSTQEHPLSFADLESMLLHEDFMRARSRERDHEEEAMNLQHEAYFTSRFQEGRQSNFRGGPRQSNFRQCPNYAAFHGCDGNPTLGGSGTRYGHFGGRFSPNRENFSSSTSSDGVIAMNAVAPIIGQIGTPSEY